MPNLECYISNAAVTKFSFGDLIQTTPQKTLQFKLSASFERPDATWISIRLFKSDNSEVFEYYRNTMCGGATGLECITVFQKQCAINQNVVSITGNENEWDGRVYRSEANRQSLNGEPVCPAKYKVFLLKENTVDPNVANYVPNIVLLDLVVTEFDAYMLASDFIGAKGTKIISRQPSQYSLKRKKIFAWVAKSGKLTNQSTKVTDNDVKLGLYASVCYRKGPDDLLRSLNENVGIEFLVDKKRITNVAKVKIVGNKEKGSSLPKILNKNNPLMNIISPEDNNPQSFDYYYLKKDGNKNDQLSTKIDNPNLIGKIRDGIISVSSASDNSEKIYAPRYTTYPSGGQSGAANSEIIAACSKYPIVAFWGHGSMGLMNYLSGYKVNTLDIGVDSLSFTNCFFMMFFCCWGGAGLHDGKYLSLAKKAVKKGCTMAMGVNKAIDLGEMKTLFRAIMDESNKGKTIINAMKECGDSSKWRLYFPESFDVGKELLFPLRWGNGNKYKGQKIMWVGIDKNGNFEKKPQQALRKNGADLTVNT